MNKRSPPQTNFVFNNPENFPKTRSPRVFIYAAIFFIILILAAIIIVHFISFENEKLVLGSSQGLDLKEAYIDGEDVKVVLGRGSASENLTEVEFIFYKGEENISIRKKVILENSEEKIFSFNSGEIPDITTYDKISVSPIYASDSGEETVGKIDDTKKISSTPPSGGGGGGSSGGTSDTGSNPVCGNGICESTEDCSVCSNDCGVCNLTCSCDFWVNNICGGGNCTSNQMQQIRTCNPSDCEIESRCVSNSSCETPTCTPDTEVCDGKDNDCDGSVDEGGVCPAPTGGFPNQPVHLIKLGEHGFPLGYASQSLGDTANYTAPGTGWYYKRYEKHSLNISPRYDAPMSPPGTMEMYYPTGMPTSGEPAAFNFYMPEQRELYVSYHFMMPSNPQSGKWELEPVGAKIIGYISFGDSPGGQQNYGPEMFKPGGLQSGPFSIRFDEYAGHPDTSVCPRYVNSQESGVIYLDQWHQIEIYLKLNDLGSDNGVQKVWVDGQLYKECQKMSFIGPYGTHGFWQIHFQPVLGGYTPGWSKTQDDYVYLDHIYIAGTPNI